MPSIRRKVCDLLVCQSHQFIELLLATEIVVIWFTVVLADNFDLVEEVLPLTTTAGIAGVRIAEAGGIGIDLGIFFIARPD